MPKPINLNRLESKVSAFIKDGESYTSKPIEVQLRSIFVRSLMNQEGLSSEELTESAVAFESLTRFLEDLREIVSTN